MSDVVQRVFDLIDDQIKTYTNKLSNENSSQETKAEQRFAIEALRHLRANIEDLQPREPDSDVAEALDWLRGNIYTEERFVSLMKERSPQLYDESGLAFMRTIERALTNARPRASMYALYGYEAGFKDGKDARVPDGWQLVPNEPTDGQLISMDYELQKHMAEVPKGICEVYKAALKSAPQPSPDTRGE